MLRKALVTVLLALCVAGTASLAFAADGDIGPKLGIVNLGRHLTPYGRQVTVGSVPMGGALTPDGKYYWAVSGGAGLNDVRIVSVKSAKVVQTLKLPGASGGIAIDPKGKRAYVSGLKDSTNKGTTQPNLPGGEGDVMHVYSISSSGKGKEIGQISVKPPKGTAPPADFPFPPSAATGYPEHPGISSDGRTLVVPLGLANLAAIVDTKTEKVRYVKVGRYPYGAAVLPGDKRALVTNEAPGTTTLIDLKKAKAIKTITTGGHLAHPEAVIAPKGRLAYIALANKDSVAVVDTKRGREIRQLGVAVKAGLGASPNSVAVSADGKRLLVGQAGTDSVSVFKIGKTFPLLGRVPTSRYPTDVAATGGSSPKLIWLTGKGLGTGPNPGGPSPFNSATLDQSGTASQFLPRITLGSVGIGAMPSDKKLKSLTKQADAQLEPENLPAKAPADTPIKANGPIKHVFWIVRENRTYDQVLGDDPRGAGDAKLTLFGPDTTPNLHALVQRFPLLDHLYADSEASMQGHQWTAAANVSDFTEKNWNQISNPFAKYGDRGRPLEVGLFAVAFPPKGYLFDQALRQGISFYNFGEPQAGNFPLPYPQLSILANTFDRDRNTTDEKAAQAKFNQSDLGPSVGGCFPNAFYLGTDILTGKQTYDSSLPEGAAEGAESRFDCWKQKFDGQLASNSVPTFNYITLPGDHTQGLAPGQLTPKAYVADNDLGTAQVIDAISHSSIWSSSAIFVAEDDSQDGADHIDAHRIPAMVVSPYAKSGVISTRYDLLSMLRTMELIMGMKPLSLYDALATPMYDAFQAAPSNIAPYDAITPAQSRIERNPGATARSIGIPLDSISQNDLDAQLWHSVHGKRSTPPPPGPNASGEDEEGDG